MSEYASYAESTYPWADTPTPNIHTPPHAEPQENTMSPANLNLTAHQVAAIATLHHATPKLRSDREVAPILAGVRVTYNGVRCTATATDRYSIAQLEFDLVPQEVQAQWSEREREEYTHESVTFVIDSNSYVQLAKRKERIDIEVGDDHVTCRAASGSVDVFALLKQNFPPVERLLPTEEDTFNLTPIAPGASFNFDKISRLAKLRAPSMLADRTTPPLFSLAATGERADESKAQTLVADMRGLTEGETLRAMLQGNLILNR